MRRRTQCFFADRLPPLVGGVEMHAAAFINHFQNHPKFPISKVISEPKPLSFEVPSILFFNSGRWIEEMPLIREKHPSALIFYRTGGNEIVKAPLSCFPDSHLERQRIWVKNLNDTVDLLITNSSYTEKRLKELGIKVPFARIVGGVESKESLSPLKKRDRGVHFFCAARFVPYKNHLLLISLFNELYRRGRAFSLTLAGDGPLLAQAKLEARENPHIHFPGRCENREILGYLEETDVYIQLSSDFETEVPGGSYVHSEGMGRSILEAISRGVYVLAGESGALSEIVTEKRGKLVPIGCKEELLSTIEALIESPPPRGSTTDEFDWKYLFKQYEGLYESLTRY